MQEFKAKLGFQKDEVQRTFNEYRYKEHNAREDMLRNIKTKNFKETLP